MNNQIYLNVAGKQSLLSLIDADEHGVSQNDIQAYKNAFQRLYAYNNHHSDTEALSVDLFYNLGIYSIKEETIATLNEIFINKEWVEINSVKSILEIIDSLSIIYDTLVTKDMEKRVAIVSDYNAIDVMGVNQKNILLINDFLSASISRYNFSLLHIQESVEKIIVTLGRTDSIEPDSAKEKDIIIPYFLEHGEGKDSQYLEDSSNEDNEKG